MKRYFYSIMVLALAFTLSGTITAKAAGPFKGTITYKITYPDSQIDASQQAMMPQVMKLKVNGNKARIEMTISGISQTFLIDSDQQSTIILLDMLGQKVALNPGKDREKPQSKEPVIEITKETKEIAGYPCKKAEIHFGDQQSKDAPTIAYYTEALGDNKLFYDNEYRTLPGIPMEFHFKMQGMNMYLTAISVEKGKVSNKDFDVPSGYTEMTPDQLRQLFGGN